MEDIWSEAGSRCLAAAKAVLESEAVPTAATVETAQRLVGMAGAIGTLDLQRKFLSRCGAAELPDPVWIRLIAPDGNPFNSLQGNRSEMP